MSCTQVVNPPPPPEAPRITSFTAAKTQLSAGEPVRLAFTATGAARVSLVDDQGQALQLEGTVTEGGVEVAPSRTTFYVLRATGPGGTTAAFLQLAVSEPLREAFLLAVPPVLEAGQVGQLLWSAAGASSVTLTERGGMPQTLTGTSGLVTITPARSTGYHLTAQGAPGTPPIEALAEVRVTPAIGTFTVDAPQGVAAGQALTFSWTTRAAARVVIAERTFGRLTEVSAAADVAAGTFSWTLPAQLPSGLDVGDGVPLAFTLTAAADGDVALRTVPLVTGNGPAFDRVVAPEAVTVGKAFTLAWKTVNASKLAVRLDGQTIFETLSGTPARAVEGSVELPGPQADSDYVLVASDASGRTAERTVRVRVVRPPIISSFTVPATLASPGSQATAQWTTQFAERVTLRLEDGPTLALVTTPSQVASGSAMVTLASTAALTLVATNAAGDSVSRTSVVRVSGGAAWVTPSPALRSTSGTASLEWQLTALGVTEVVGLDTTPPDAGVGSTNFIDLSASTSATELTFTEPNNGAEKLPDLAGFVFPLAGRAMPELWVSANGFIAFAQPAALSTNSDIGLTSNTSPAMVAPFWDDLLVPSSGKVLYELRTDMTSGERFVVVQWHKVQLANSTSSELTFQAQLFETGRVRLVYGAMTGTLTSATVGVKASHELVRRRFQYNTTGGPVVQDLELEYFTGGPADGTLDVSRAQSRRINFFGRTATGLVAVSAQLRTFGVGDIAITEAMPFPHASASAGQWLELRNELTTPLDLEGLVVTSALSTPDGGYVLPAVSLDAGAYLVIGESTDPTANGGAPVSLVMTDVPLSPQDTVRVLVQGTTVASLTWDGGTLGESIFVPEGLLTAPGNAVACARSATFGPNGAFGSPGARNETCAPYVISRVDAGFVDLTGSTELLASASDYSGTGTVTLPAPFTYYGQQFTSMNLSLGAGFFSFGNALTSDYVSNPSAPSTAEPNGVVAPFWDELVRNSGSDGDGAVFMRRDGTRTIISWQDFRVYADFDSHIYFQVHLIDPDIIEFHYGSMETGSTTQSNIDKHRGSTATVWLENPAGTVAVPFSVNEQRITSHMGLRFTPAP